MSGHIPRLAVLIALFTLAVPGTASFAFAQERNFNAYPENVTKYLQRIYSDQEQPLAFRPGETDDIAKWQQGTREVLRQKIGLPKIAQSAGDHRPVVKLGEIEDQGDYTRQLCEIETEPDIHIPFWLLKPKGEGPWPLALFPHGHDRRGHNTSAGVYADEAHQKKSLAEDRDVAVQAVKRGFFAIAPTVRGLSADGVPDLFNRHGKQSCRSHNMHCLLAGRTATGERVWDMSRLIDWALTQEEVDGSQVLMMGNSGGGMITLFAAACDERITIAVSSCAFAPTTSRSGYLFHCDCNMIPGMIEIGGLPEVAGLIAPRHLVTVNGSQDPLFSKEAIARGTQKVQAIYQATGTPAHYEHRWGEAGHRFYAHLMWPFVQQAMEARGE